jgi:hypothetical protein
MEPKPDKECEKRGDIFFLSEIITNSIYSQEMSDFEKHQISIRFGTYHRYPLTFDNLNLSALRHEVAHFDG